MTNELEQLKGSAAQYQRVYDLGVAKGFVDPLIPKLLADLDRVITIAEANDRDCHMYMDQRDQARADVLKSRKVIMRADVDETLAFMADTEHYEVTDEDNRRA